MGFSNLIPKIFAQSLPSIRSAFKALSVCTVNFQAETAKLGDTISVPVPVSSGVTDVTPGVSPEANTAKTPTTKDLKLENWKRSDKIALTGKEIAEFESGDFKNSQLLEQTIAVLNQVSLDMLTGMKNASWRRSGTAGTNPYASTDADTIDIRKQLNQALAPSRDRHLLLGPNAEARALAIGSIKDASLRGNDMTKKEGEIGRLLGIDHWGDQQIVKHTAGTAAGTLTLGTTIPAVGAYTINLKASTTGTLKKGDLIKVTTSSVDYFYAVAADVATVDTTAAGIQVTLVNPIQATHVAGDTWVLTASHSANIGLQRGGYALAFRMLDTRALGMGEHTQVTDPETGLSLIYSVIPEYMQTSMMVSCLYAHGPLRNEFLVRLLGDPANI